MALKRHVFYVMAAIVAMLGISSITVALSPVAVKYNSVPTEKLDSGLGELPHYSEWINHPATRHLVSGDSSNVPGEKLDSGLGELPHYGNWVNHPATSYLVSGVSSTHVPGEKLDSGLGELPHYTQWMDNTGKLQLTVLSSSR